MKPSRGFGQEARLIVSFLVQSPLWLLRARALPLLAVLARSNPSRLTLSTGRAHTVFRISPAAPHVTRGKWAGTCPESQRKVVAA